MRISLLKFEFFQLSHSIKFIRINSKVMIVDDCCALVGSLNINDQSLLGSRVSEIDFLIEDEEFVDSSMGGKPWKAGKFLYSLRLSLWAEHLGVLPEDLGSASAIFWVHILYLAL